MLKNYFKIAYRNLIKNKVYSFINIAGLSVGMAIAMLIGLWVVDELLFDKQFKNYERIAQVWQHSSDNGTINTRGNEPFPLAEELRRKYGSDFKHVALSTWNDMHLLGIGDKNIGQQGIYCEPDLTKILSLDMVAGTADGLKDVHAILLSASLAKACFGDANPINKTLKMDNAQDVMVVGVYKDLPYNSSFAEVSFMAPWALYYQMAGLAQVQNPWRSNSFQLFAQIGEHSTMAGVSQKIKDAKLDNISIAHEVALHPQLFLHPMRDWHLYSAFENGVNAGGRIQYVWLFAISGIFVLLLACINFMNLSTARSEKRAKEVGIRKAIGSQCAQLIQQFFSESLLMAGIALMMALLLAQLLLPLFNQLADKKVTILWENPLFWLVCFGFTLITGFIAGSYPAFYLSSFRPVKVLKGTFRVGRSAAIPRRVLVVLQFAVSVILIVSTLVVYQQIKYAQGRPLGYDSNGLVMVEMYTNDIHRHFDVVRDELLKTGAVVEMAESGSPVTAVWSTNSGFNWEGKDPGMGLDFPNTGVSPEYGKTVGWQFVAGRDFSKAFKTDSAAFVINETAARFMGLKDPVGKTITWDDAPYTIIGVIKDMVVESPYDAIRPSLYYMDGGSGSRMIVKVNPAVSTSVALPKIEAIFKKYSPRQPFEYQFADQEYARKFGDEQRIARLAGVFAILAVFISCLGLFGMASFMAEQRTKEIGVRKVMGASIFDLWRLLSTEFVIMVAISLIIAFPLAYYAMDTWLQHYQYRSGIALWIFAVAAFGALFITLLTVSFQAIKAAMANPIRSLRTE
ncbi:ABC transporter permease [Chitinophaga defluvii]|uniref:ABC transporter permease n=1 Tax=Chitinophaga defluvii TaxID=3163343 RepID=A0ABV2T9S1_9BACT